MISKAVENKDYTLLICRVSRGHFSVTDVYHFSLYENVMAEDMDAKEMRMISTTYTPLPEDKAGAVSEYTNNNTRHDFYEALNVFCADGPLSKKIVDSVNKQVRAGEEDQYHVIYWNLVKENIGDMTKSEVFTTVIDYMFWLGIEFGTINTL